MFDIFYVIVKINKDWVFWSYWQRKQSIGAGTALFTISKWVKMAGWINMFVSLIQNLLKITVCKTTCTTLNWNLPDRNVLAKSNTCEIHCITLFYCLVFRCIDDNWWPYELKFIQYWKMQEIFIQYLFSYCSRNLVLRVLSLLPFLYRCFPLF